MNPKYTHISASNTLLIPRIIYIVAIVHPSVLLAEYSINVNNIKRVVKDAGFSGKVCIFAVVKENEFDCDLVVVSDVIMGVIKNIGNNKDTQNGKGLSSQTPSSNVNRKGAFKIVPSDELRKRRVNVYPYLM